jgi:alpha-1,6-mannosyltransferase
MKALPLMGLANLALLLVAIRFFVAELFPEEDRDRISFYFLLFMLVLWGRNPWVWSSFFNLSALGYVLPYPSTFAMALSFVGLALFLRSQRDGGAGLLIALSAIVAVVLTTHPSTSITLYVMLAALEAGRSEPSPRGFAALAAALGAALVLALLWPYFPLFGILDRAQAVEFHANSRVLYERPLAQMWPALIGLYPLWLRWRADRRDPLALAATGLGLLYLYGWASGRWGYGRCISHLVLLLQLAAAQWAARLESERRRAYAIVLSLTLYAAWGFRPAVREAFSGSSMSYDRSPLLSRLPGLAGPKDVILSDSGTNWIITAFAGRVVSYDLPLYWVPDLAQRRADAARFFAAGTPCQERADIVRKYGAKFLLLNRSSAPAARELDGLFRQWGDLVYEDGNFLLARVKPTLGCAGYYELAR